MKTITIDDLKINTDQLIDGAINDEFFKVKTQNGTAVVISEAEWDILIESLMHLTQ